MADTTQFCPSCGNAVRPDARFCDKCGAAIDPPPARSGAKLWWIGGLACLGMAAVLACLLVGGGLIYYRARSLLPAATALVVLPVTEVAPEKAPTAPPVAAPTLAGPEPTVTPEPAGIPLAQYSDDRIAFSYDPSLADRVVPEEVAAQTGEDTPPWGRYPAHTVYHFENYHTLVDSNRTPQIAVYPAEDYAAMDASADEEIRALQQILSDRRTAGLPVTLPFLPSWPAAQVIAARVTYLDFRGGSGVAFLTQYAQDAFPINNQSMFYTFQGLTSDNRWYVSAILPVANPDLPDPETLIQDPKFIDNYQDYLAETRDFLASQPADAFTPNLDLLDAMLQSIEVR